MSEALAEPVAEPVAAEPVAPAEPAVEPAAAAPNWDDPALLELVDSRAAEIAQQLTQQQFGQIAPLLEQFLGGDQAQQGQPQLPQLVDEFGQLDPNALVQLLSTQQQQTFAAIDQRLQALQAPLAARFEQETVAEGNQRLNDILADDISRNGEFSADPQADASARSLVRTLAEQAFPQVAERYGATPRAAEMAMNRAATQVREILAADRRAHQSTEQNRLATLAGARREPGVAAAGVEGLSEKPLSTRELAAKYAARATALAGT